MDHEQLSNPNGVPGQFNYNFNFLNNTNVPIGYLYIVPQTNCLTASPDIIQFSPPLPPGATTNVSVVLTVSPNCSSNFCFTFAAHTTNLTECCSAIHCINSSSSTGQPKLDIALAGTNAVIWWPAQFTNHVLECTSNLNPPIIWAPAPGTPVVANERILVTIPIGSAAARFYRLRLP